MPSKSKLRTCITLFLVQLVQYCIFCISCIVMNRGQYAATFVTDMFYGLNAFFIVKKIASSDNVLGIEAAAYTVGGATGSVLAIWITKHWLHQQFGI